MKNLAIKFTEPKNFDLAFKQDLDSLKTSERKLFKIEKIEQS